MYCVYMLAAIHYAFFVCVFSYLGLHMHNADISFSLNPLELLIVKKQPNFSSLLGGNPQWLAESCITRFFAKFLSETIVWLQNVTLRAATAVDCHTLFIISWTEEDLKTQEQEALIIDSADISRILENVFPHPEIPVNL